MITKIIMCAIWGMIFFDTSAAGTAKSLSWSNSFAYVKEEETKLQKSADTLKDMKSTLALRSAALITRAMDTPDAAGTMSVADELSGVRGDITSRRKLKNAQTDKERELLCVVKEQDHKVYKAAAVVGIPAAVLGITGALCKQNSPAKDSKQSMAGNVCIGIAAGCVVVGLYYCLPRMFHYSGAKKRLKTAIDFAENTDDSADSLSGQVMLAERVGQVVVAVKGTRAELSIRCDELSAQGRAIIESIRTGKLDVEKHFAKIEALVTDLTAVQRAIAEEVKKIHEELMVVSERTVAIQREVAEGRAESGIIRAQVVEGRAENQAAHARDHEAHARADQAAGDVKRLLASSAEHTRMLEALTKLFEKREV